MKSMTITIRTENTAFDPDPVPELARLLQRTTAMMELESDSHYWCDRLYDVNGNYVGEITIT